MAVNGFIYSMKSLPKNYLKVNERKWISINYVVLFREELADEFQTISMNKSSQIYQQRFEQLRQQKVKIPSQPIKPKSSQWKFLR